MVGEVLEEDGLEEVISLKKNLNPLTKFKLNISKEILELSNKKSELNANVSLAEQIKLKDGKCPVCNSEVDHLNELFQIEHIAQEISQFL